MNEENIKMTLSLIDACLKNLKPDKITQIHLDGLRKTISLMYEDCSIEDVTNLLIRYNLPVLRFPKGSSELCD